MTPTMLADMLALAALAVAILYGCIVVYYS
jgi:hypothetical protein